MEMMNECCKWLFNCLGYSEPLLQHDLWLISSITFSPDLFRVVISDPQIFLYPHIFLPIQLLLPPYGVSIHFFNQQMQSWKVLKFLQVLETEVLHVSTAVEQTYINFF